MTVRRGDFGTSTTARHIIGGECIIVIRSYRLDRIDFPYAFQKSPGQHVELFFSVFWLGETTAALVISPAHGPKWSNLLASDKRFKCVK
jgi:hypothetical protein